MDGISNIVISRPPIPQNPQQKFHDIYLYDSKSLIQIQQIVGKAQQEKMLNLVAEKICKIIPSHKFKSFDSLGMTSCIPYYVYFMMMIIGFTLQEKTHNSFVILFFIYGVIPLLDEIFTLDTRNPTKEQKQKIQNDIKFQIPLLITIFLDWFFFFYVMNHYSKPITCFSDIVRLIGMLIIVSNNNAAQFAIAHQIFHKPGWRRILGTVHMIKNFDMHFTYEHLYGHHKRVATPEDPATSRYNEKSFHFVVRSYFRAYGSVYQMEKETGKQFYNNYAVWSVLGSMMFSVCIYQKYGLQALIFMVFQAAGAIFYLETINYIEHYGLKRKKLANGQYEKVTIKHSWNAPHRFSNYLLFKLQRHSDHHQSALKPYQILQTLDQSPQLPHGYIVMTLMAMFPDTFRSIMNPLVNEEEGNQNVEDLPRKQAIAIQQTRKFIIKISLCAGMALIFSEIWIK